jgi:hypothetical protein
MVLLFETRIRFSTDVREILIQSVAQGKTGSRSPIHVDRKRGKRKVL